MYVDNLVKGGETTRMETKRNEMEIIMNSRDALHSL